VEHKRANHIEATNLADLKRHWCKATGFDTIRKIVISTSCLGLELNYTSLIEWSVFLG